LADVHVAYVVSDYPKVSHAFIQREVLALRELGVRVDTYSVKRAPDAELLTDLDRAEAARTTALRPTTALAVLRDHVRALRRSPRGYRATWRLARRASPPGARARLWQTFYFATAVLLHERVQRTGARHLHAHLANTGTDVTWLAAELGNRSGTGRWTWSFTMHGPTEFREVTRYNLARKVAAADAVACISDFCRSQLMALVEPEHWPKLRIVHCGVDLAAYPLAVRPPGGPCTVLDVGRLVPEKGHAVLVEAVARVVRAGADVRLVVAGDGPEREALAADAARAGLGDRATFLGAVGQDRMAALYGTADVFCLPSFAEGVPVVLMEAMATGMPVVTTPIAGIPELVRDGEEGLLVPPGRADLLADAIAGLAVDAGRRAALGRRGRARVEAEFDVGREARRLARLFAAVRAGDVTAADRPGGEDPGVDDVPGDRPADAARAG
jgi:glycosyltransferase involved in cell wall biosynthesis